MSGLTGFVVASAVAGGGAVVAVAVSDSGEPSPTRTVVTQVIDGDTVEIQSGEHVRLIGLDTPEGGACGYELATSWMRRMTEGREVRLINPSSVQDEDAYGRLLRYIEVVRLDLDAGYAQILAARGVARYDSRDGYDEHPREDLYRSADARSEGLCEEQKQLRERRQQVREEKWRAARRLALEAHIRIKEGETAVQLARRARAILDERRLQRLAARQAPPAPVPAPPAQAPNPSPPRGESSGGLVYTTDNDHGYTGPRCYQPDGYHFVPC